MTVQSLGLKANVHHSSVVRVERGEFQTMSPTVQKICTALNLAGEVNGFECDLTALLTRIERLASQQSHVARAIEALVDAFEASSVQQATTRRAPPPKDANSG